MNDDSCRTNDGFLAVRSEVLRELGGERPRRLDT